MVCNFFFFFFLILGSPLYGSCQETFSNFQNERFICPVKSAVKPCGLMARADLCLSGNFALSYYYFGLRTDSLAPNDVVHYSHELVCPI